MPADFDSVYRGHFLEVVRWARALGTPETDIEDVAQENFLVVQKKLPAFDGRNLTGWLFRITQLTVRDHRRRSWFKHLVQMRAPLSAWDEASYQTPVTDLEMRERQRVLNRALRKLGGKKRETFVLFELLGYSGDDIATLQGVPVNTVWTRLHAARKQFMQIVEQMAPHLQNDASESPDCQEGARRAESQKGRRAEGQKGGKS